MFPWKRRSGFDGKVAERRRTERIGGVRRKFATPARISKKVLIPLPLFWIEPTGINSNSVIGADVDYIIIGVDREGECAIAARSLALEQQRWHALNVQHIADGDVVSASVLACGPTRITVTACGFDVTMGQ